MKIFFIVVSAFFCCSCGGGSVSSGSIVPDATSTAATAISVSRQIEIEDRLVSAFENSTTVIQYGYISNLNDGRGFTAGRAGFTSGTGDMLEVVVEYGNLNPDNPLSGYQTALEAVNGTASTVGLTGIEQAWAAAAQDPKFITAQDNVNDRLYRQPARLLALQVGAQLPLAKAAIYEAGIQHGFGDDYDSINMIVDRASARVGGAPKDGVDEKVWLRAVLQERKNDLLAPANTDTASEWADSVDRANVMLELYDSGNANLDKPIVITVFGDTFSI